MTSVKISKKFICFVKAVGLIILLASCAHDVTPVALPQTANPSQEVDILASKLETAKNEKLDLLAPKNYQKAEKSLKEAQERREKNQDGDKILKAVGYGHAYLNQAKEASYRSQEQLADVIKSRNLALAGGAEQYSNDLVQSDKKLKKHTERIEENKSVDRKDLGDLQAEYIDLELKSIKGTKLSEAKNTLDNAEKIGAKSLTPTAYQQAQEKISAAEKAIETDRHDQQAIQQAANAATMAARQTLVLVNTAKENKNRSPEQLAREIEDRNSKLSDADQQIDAAQAQMTTQDRQLARNKTQLGTLKEKEQFNKAFDQARAEFTPEEADVYRQGDNMIIRLKNVNFSSGRAELPAAAFPVLNKIKNVMGQLNTEEIIVEGHTDSTGSAAKNKELSAKRASAVATYFIAEDITTPDQIEALGYGYEKPIATNKSKEGRAQNRRVDIVIKPARAANDAGSSKQ